MIGDQLSRISDSFSSYFASNPPFLPSGRVCDPESSYERILPWAKQYLTRVAETTRLDRLFLPTFYAIRPDALCPAAIVSSGKGADRKAAMLSAMYEAYERWAAEEAASPHFLANRVNLRNCFPSVPCIAPEWLDELECLPWVVSYELISSAPCFVPLEAVRFPVRRSPSGCRGISKSTNGLASGTDALEAICAGILEVLERDAIQKIQVTALETVDVRSLSGTAEAFATEFIHHGVELTVCRCPSPTGVPVFYCLSRDDSFGVSVFFCCGCGAHPDSRVAATRALSEVGQSRVAFISSLREDISFRVQCFTSVPYDQRRRGLEHWFDLPARVRFEDIPRHTHFRAKEQFDFLLNRFKSGFPSSPLTCTPLRQFDRLFAFRIYAPDLMAPEPPTGDLQLEARCIPG